MRSIDDDDGPAQPHPAPWLTHLSVSKHSTGTETSERQHG